MQKPVVVVGAGIGGLVAAANLARDGIDVVVLEQASHVGGKMNHVHIDGQPVDIGPTVMTMRHVFDELFASCGRSLDDYVQLHRLHLLARHFWDDAPSLDLFADPQRSEAAVADAFGGDAARGFVRFCAYSQKLYELACAPFVYAARPSWTAAYRAFGLRAVAAAWHIDARRSMMQALAAFFPHTSQLRQLFGRYATYHGASPYRAPATLNLIAHVERLGVWGVAGGMHRLAQAVCCLAEEMGAQVRLGQTVARIVTAAGRACGVQLADGTVVGARAVVFNGDVRALAPLPRRGPPPVAAGLSAVTWAMRGHVAGAALSGHNVVFAAAGGKAEFDGLFEGGPPCAAPTVYICAPNRKRAAAPGRLAGADGEAIDAAPEPLFCLVNAAPRREPLTTAELAAYDEGLHGRLAACGMALSTHSEVYRDTPAAHARRYPRSDGALYGSPPHSWRAFFTRPTARSSTPGLFCAGGTTHPGPGVPMAALSGKLAAQAVRDGA